MFFFQTVKKSKKNTKITQTKTRNKMKAKTSADVDAAEKLSLFTLIIDLLKSGRDITETLSKMGILWIFHFFNIFIVSGKKFNEDDCSTKSSAIAYTTLVSLIPTLTVIVTFVFARVGMQKEQLFQRITRFLAEQNLERLNVEPFFEAISGLLENAAGIGVIGAAVTVFSATALLRTIESSLNRIFKVKRQRSIFLRVIYFWAALTLGPIIVITGSTLATQISKVLTGPDYTSIRQFDDELWLTGSKGSFGRVLESDTQLRKTTADNIDIDNFRSFSYIASEKTFVPDEDVSLDLSTLRSTLRNLTFTDIAFIGQEGWLIGEKGYILRTSDGGLKWRVSKWSYFNFRKISMLDSLKGYIVGDSGTLMKTVDGGENWTNISFQTTTVDFNDITFSAEHGIIAADKGYILLSDDGGENWFPRQLIEAKQKKHYSDINAVSVIEQTILLAGNDGTVLHSDDMGKSWDLHKYRSFNYTAALLQSSTVHYLATSNGQLLKTSDNGSTYIVMSEGSAGINNLLRDHSSRIWICGNTGLLQFSTEGSLLWKGPNGKSSLLVFMKLFTPFFFIWLLFFLMYIAMPNTKVPFKAAALGASFTAAVWVLFIFCFIIYVNSFANGTFAIYGALAAFPIFLLLIFTSMQIILFGAEVAYTIANPYTYRRIRKRQHHAFGNAINAVRMIAHIFRKFESGKGASSVDELIKVCNNDYSEMMLFAEIYLHGKLITQTDDKYQPATSSRNIKISEVLDMIYDFSLDFRGGEKDSVAQRLGDKFEKINSARSKILGDERLSDII